jgi:hypothetical protein
MWGRYLLPVHRILSALGQNSILAKNGHECFIKTKRYSVFFSAWTVHFQIMKRERVTNEMHLQSKPLCSAETCSMVFQEERSIIWDVTVSVILSKNIYMNMSSFTTVSEIQPFDCIAVWFGRSVLSFPPAMQRHCLQQ